MAESQPETATSATANPLVLGEIILDADEDSQVVVWEDGAPTAWALQFIKWRLYFKVDETGVAQTSASLTSSSEDDKGRKRKFEDTELELN